MKGNLAERIKLLKIQEVQRKGKDNKPFTLLETTDSEGVITRAVPFFNQPGYDNETSVASSANGCKSPRVGINLASKVSDKPRKDDEDPKEFQTIAEKTYFYSGLSDHNAVDEKSGYMFSFGKGGPNSNGATRLETLFFCQMMFGFSALQQSMRFVNASKLFTITDDKQYKFDKVLSPEILKSKLFNETEQYLNEIGVLYGQMQEEDEDKVKTEVARMITPLCTPTNIEFNLTTRALKDIAALVENEYTPKRIKRRLESMLAIARYDSDLLISDEALEKINKTRSAYPIGNFLETDDYWQPQIAAKEKEIELIDITGNLNITEELIHTAMNDDQKALQYLKQFKIQILDEKNLIVQHQDERQRSKDMSIESIYNAIKKGKYDVPSSIKGSKWGKRWHDISQKGLNLYAKLIDAGVPQEEALDVIPQNLVINTVYTLNGWNLIKGAMDKRLCENAQPEIRVLYEKIRNIIVEKFPVFKEAIAPPCVKGKCTEKIPCGKYSSVMEKYKK